MNVHNALGCGFLEAGYQDALAVEFEALSIPFRREVDLPVFYRGQRLAAGYRADFICFDSVVVELKALSATGCIEEAQVINYLKAGKFTTGLLLNFGAESLDFRRFVRSSSAQSA